MHGHTGGSAALKEALQATDPQDRALALGAALRAGLLTEELLRTAIGDNVELVRRRAIELAPRLVAAEGAPAISDATLLCIIAGLDDPSCAEVAAFSLGELGIASEEVVGPLETQALEHDDPLCRESAIGALGALGAGSAAVLAALDDVATVRRRAVIALVNFEGDEIDAALERAKTDRDWQVRQAAEDLREPD